MSWASLFPGQGSQQVGMGKVLFENFKVAKELFEEASDTLSISFKDLCFNGPEDKLNLTENTQPAILLVSKVCHQVLETEAGFEPEAYAGHSVGEYGALVAAGVIDFPDALRAVKLRGGAMQEAVPVGQGGMLAVLGLSDEGVVELCKIAVSRSGQSPLEPANFNAPGQVVVSGNGKAISWVLDEFKPEALSSPPLGRFRLMPLKVSAPFHCSLMKPAQEKMAQFFEGLEFRPPKAPIVQNLVGQAVTGPAELKANLVGQVSGSVQWAKSIQALPGLGVKRCVEVGNGRVLAGLLKKIDTPLSSFNMNSVEQITSLIEEIRG